jgi:AraC family transcriptional regulator
LTETCRNILEVAVTYRYGSQEAFTRAFEGYFGMTPARYRKSGTRTDQLKKINFLDFSKIIKGDVNMNKPDIIHLKKTDVIGYEYRTTLMEQRYFTEIPGFYEDFGRNEYYMRIPGRIAPAFAYGISCSYRDNGDFSYIVGEAVQGPAENPGKGFVNFEIPEGKYAEFKVDAPIELVQNTWRYIYSTWLPNSNYERRDGPDFEVNDVSNSVNGHSMKIYIPIK